MSLTIPQSFRTQKSNGTVPEPQADVLNVTRPQTTFELANDLLDRLMGPSQYHGVHLLNRAAEYCSDQCLIEATRINGAAYCEGFARACLMLTDLADSIDRYLVESFLNEEASRG